MLWGWEEGVPEPDLREERDIAAAGADLRRARRGATQERRGVGEGAHGSGLVRR
jgi:hypothetical protein